MKWGPVTGLKLDRQTGGFQLNALDVSSSEVRDKLFESFDGKPAVKFLLRIRH